jgi:hypothetical protein
MAARIRLCWEPFSLNIEKRWLGIADRLGRRPDGDGCLGPKILACYQRVATTFYVRKSQKLPLRPNICEFVAEHISVTDVHPTSA